MAAAGMSRNAIWRSPEPTSAAEARPVAGGRAPRERREQHGGHRDREHALRQHVDAERLVDGGRPELLVDAGREPRVDEQVEVDQPESERHRQHQREDALHGLVARVAEPRDAAEAAHRRIRDRELHGRAEQDAEGVRVEPLVGRLQERQAERPACPRSRGSRRPARWPAGRTRRARSGSRSGGRSGRASRPSGRSRARGRRRASRGSRRARAAAARAPSRSP